MRTVEIDGALWVRHADRRCARCGTRTYRVSRRIGRELLMRPQPGAKGAYSFSRATGPKKLFTLCGRCFLDAFAGNELRVHEWAYEHPERS